MGTGVNTELQSRGREQSLRNKSLGCCSEVLCPKQVRGQLDSSGEQGKAGARLEASVGLSEERETFPESADSLPLRGLDAFSWPPEVLIPRWSEECLGIQMEGSVMPIETVCRP